ncbi:hypothetical protein T492DRAFT_1117409, partial [Pavlovales sp. CCMP2436]
DGGPLSSRSSSPRTQHGAARASLQLRAQNKTRSHSSRSPSRRARRARWSAGRGTDSTARPRHSKREARDHREAAGRARARRCALTGGRARHEGAPRGRAWKRRRRLMLGKKEEQDRARQLLKGHGDHHGALLRFVSGPTSAECRGAVFEYRDFVFCARL